MTVEIPLDTLAYVAKVAEWLQSCPDGKTTYGEFYPPCVPVSFDGQLIGTFKNEDPEWVFELDAKYWGLTTP